MKTNSHVTTNLTPSEGRRSDSRRTLQTTTGLFLLALLGIALLACSRSQPAASPAQQQSTPGAATADQQQTEEAALAQRLQTISNGVNGDIGVAVIHVESGRSVEVEGAKMMPLYSVYKLPLAITVLGEVEATNLSLDQKVQVTPDDVAPGSQANSDLWRQPVDKTVAELLEFSIVRSDNTSTDKLLPLVGGPMAVTERMRALGFSNIDIKYSSREFAAHRDKPNTATASDLAQLLTKLQKGELLKAPQLALLLGFMERARTGGERRIRANLPAGTQVAEKTGSGEDTTNDVGLITLPQGKGHLAIAVLITRSKLSAEAQEKVIADIARAAYDSFVATLP
ncbi:MAG TPA: class A beta-lactamase [Pyrinomonadaceae bacterium]|nr:class A beta-lactamase [Pyrinomonadaceae bacterium]